MGKNNTYARIGWFCPYTLPPLLQIKNVQMIQIVWKQGAYSHFGNICLCQKMTALMEAVQTEKINGLVIPECCNITYSVQEYLARVYPYLQLYRVQIPRKADEYFYHSLLSQWQTLYNTIVNTSPPNENAFAKMAEPCFVSQFGWCSLPEGFLIYKKDYKELISDIQKAVYCPRLIFENTGNNHPIKMEHLNTEPDDHCILQRYHYCLKEKCDD